MIAHAVLVAGLVLAGLSTLFLLQCSEGGVHKPVTRRFAADALDRAMAAAGLAGPEGTPPRITPHDFRRIFATDAPRVGLSPHTAAKIIGRIDLNATMGEARNQVTYLGMRGFRPAAGRSSGAGGGP